MQAEQNTVQQFGENGENPCSFEGRAGSFPDEDRIAVRLTDAEIRTIARRLVHRECARVRLWTTLVATALLLATGSAIAPLGTAFHARTFVGGMGRATMTCPETR